MNAPQKHAWFSLVVIALTLLLILALAPWLGYRAMGAFGLLGVLGFGGWFVRKRPGQVVVDERDQQIQLRSFTLAHVIFWVLWCLVAALGAPLYYGENGVVPVAVVQLSVLAGFVFVTVISSVATLVQYARGAEHAHE